MLRTYAVCDECEESEILYRKVDRPDFTYEKIVGDEGEPRFEERHGWLIKGYQSPDDPIAVEFDYYCPQCLSEERIEDSGDR